MKRYAWMIFEDKIAEDGAPPATNANAVGMIGPSNAPLDLIREVKQARGGTKFRMLDDDGEVYYVGYLVAEDWGGEDHFGPLDDFGMPNAGCTEIQFLCDDGWKSL